MNPDAIFALMEAVDDTTVLYRGGIDAGRFVRRAAAGFLADGDRVRVVSLDAPDEAAEPATTDTAPAR